MDPTAGSTQTPTPATSPRACNAPQQPFGCRWRRQEMKPGPSNPSLCPSEPERSAPAGGAGSAADPHPARPHGLGSCRTAGAAAPTASGAEGGGRVCTLTTGTTRGPRTRTHPLAAEGAPLPGRRSGESARGRGVPPGPATLAGLTWSCSAAAQSRRHSPGAF